MKSLLIPIVAIALLSGCANFSQNVQTYLGPPSQVQADITYLGGRAKQYLSADMKAKLHQAGTMLQTASTGDITPILALFPSHTGNTVADMFIATLKSTLTLAVALYSSNLPTLLEYLHAGGAGLLANF